MNAFSGSGLSSVHIPSSCTTIGNGAFDTSGTLKEITVSPECTTFFEREGILYRRYVGGEIGIYVYPNGREDTSYTADNDIEYVAVNAFNRCTKLKEVTLPRAALVCEDAFAGCTAGLTVTVPETCEVREQQEGVKISRIPIRPKFDGLG